MPGTSCPSIQEFRLACPVCRGTLRISAATALCVVCGKQYARVEDVWQLLPENREDHYRTFLGQYRRIRRDQGWGKSSAAYYRLLPWVEPTDPQQSVWSLRAQHYQAFIRKV